MTLIERHHEANGITSRALYSPCEKYRYELDRTWDAGKPRLGFVMLNPSKATEVQNDPTIERCQRRATALGYGAMRIANLFSWRETDPARLKRRRSPVGPETDARLAEMTGWADDILCAWGVHGVHKDRHHAVLPILARGPARLLHLGLTKDGLPRHPLYVSYATRPVVWAPDV